MPSHNFETSSIYNKLLDIERRLDFIDKQKVIKLRETNSKSRNMFVKNWKFLKNNSIISEIIARRMFYYSRNQKELTKFLQIAQAASTSHVLEQSFGIYLNAYLNSLGNYKVETNSMFPSENQSICPDIAIKRNGEKLAVIETKIDMGWQRDYFHIPKHGKSKWGKRIKQCSEAGFKKCYIFMQILEYYP